MEVANQKFASMSELSLKELTLDGKIRIYALPKLEAALKFNIDQSETLLRFCPFSDFFGINKAQFRTHGFSLTKCR